MSSPSSKNVIGHRVWQATFPLERAIKTPGGLFDRADVVVVELSDGRGNTGSGYAYGTYLASLNDLTGSVQNYLAAGGRELSTLLLCEHYTPEEGPFNYKRHFAMSAISMAAWDLLGRQSGKTCAELWGSTRPNAPLDAYASGLFLDIDEAALVAEATEYRRRHFRLVKMRGGLSPAEDAERYEAIRRIYPEPLSIAGDFYLQTSVAGVAEFLGRVKQPPLWIEDPTSHDIIGDFARDLPISAGENCTSLAALMNLHNNGVRKLLLDVQYIGGPLKFLEAARCLHGLGGSIGSHMFAHESTHLLSCIPESLPVEVLNWWDPIFNEDPVLDAQGQLVIKGPGLGRTLNMRTLERYGTLTT